MAQFVIPSLKSPSMHRQKPLGCHIHHIDWNHKNNNPSNIICVPELVHVIIHKCGYLTREEIVRLMKVHDLAVLERRTRGEIEKALIENPTLTKCQVKRPAPPGQLELDFL